MEGGRPTKYKVAYNAQAEKLCKLGATDAELADFFEVAESTINLWKLEHPKFSESISRGKLRADMEVANSLFKTATGFDYTEKTININDKGKEAGGTIHKRKALPDYRSMRLWLINRQPKKWRDKMETGFTNNEGEDVAPVQIVYELPHNARDNNAQP